MTKTTTATEETPIVEGIYCPKQNENREIAKPVRMESVEDFMDWGNWADCIKIETKLITSKLFYFAFFSARGALTPFMSIYLKQLGLRPGHIGLVTGLRPLLGFPSGPAWGAIADRFKLRRILFYISLIGWLVFKMALGFIPATKPIDVCPNLINVTNWSRIVRSFDTAADERLIDLAIRQRKSTNASPISVHGQQHLVHSVENELAPATFYNHFFHVISDKESMSWLYDPADIKRVFVTLALLVLFGEVLQAPTSALADAGTIDKLGTGNEHKYSLQRAWGSLGFGISAFTVGNLLNMSRHQVMMCGTKVSICDYMMPFYVFGGCMALAILAGLSFKFKGYENRGGNEHNLQSLRSILMTVHYASWLFITFYMGTCNGVIWGFLYWHLENLGASQMLLGVVIATTYTCEFTMFFFVDRLVLKPFGCIGTLYLALVCYCMRFTTYAIIEDPWLVIPAEMLQAVTFSGVWSSMTRYSIQTVPKDSLATMQGIIHGMYWGLGLGTGHLIGGVMMSQIGAHKTFGCMGITSIMILILFAIAQHFSEKPEPIKPVEETTAEQR